MNNNSFSHDSNAQFALSYELLHLLKWLAENDVDKLKKIINKAIAHGLHDEIQNTSYLTDSDNIEEMHHSIVDFFELLNSLLTKGLNEHIKQKAKQKNLLPTIDQFDRSLFDSDVIRHSMETATKQLELDPQVNPKEQLCKELLKQWKPSVNRCELN